MVIKHLGQWRDLELKQVSADSRILRILHRKGTQLESVLMNYSKLSKDALDDSLLRLSRDYEMIEISAPHYANARRVRLTSKGASYALELICEIKEWNAGGSLKHPRPTLDELTANNPEGLQTPLGGRVQIPDEVTTKG